MYSVFAEQELQQGDIIVTNNKNSLVTCMYIVKNSLLFDDSSCSHSFFYSTIVISRGHLRPSIRQIHCVYFTRINIDSYCNKRSVVDSSKLKGAMFFE